MNEFEYIHHEINRIILLIRSENDSEKKQSFLDEIGRLNNELKRLYDSK